MSRLRAARWVLLASTLGLGGSASGAVTLASAAQPPHHHHSPAIGPCSCPKHHRCPRARAGTKARHGQTQCRSAKRAAPRKLSSGSGQPAPWTAFPTGGVPAAAGPQGAAAAPEGPAGASPPVESPAAPPPPARVEVTAEDTGAFRFVLSRPSVPAGKVIIEFVNHGQDEHNLNAFEPAEGALAGSIPNTQPNAHPSLTLTLRPGTYTLFCSIADHEAKGMKATLVVN